MSVKKKPLNMELAFSKQIENSSLNSEKTLLKEPINSHQPEDIRKAHAIRFSDKEWALISQKALNNGETISGYIRRILITKI